MRCGGQIATAIQTEGGFSVTCAKTTQFTIRFPLLRGLIALWESLSTGIRQMIRSAKGNFLRTLLLVAGYLAMMFGMGYLAEVLLANINFSHYILENLCWNGVFVVEIVILLFFLRRIPAIERLFGYHAAEHMTINCYENGLPLTIENVRSCSRIHPRCGTNIAVNCILLVLLFETFLPPIGNKILYYACDTLGVLLLFALAYEGMRYAEKKRNHFSRFINFPGKLAQKYITTAPPNDAMLACGIAALRKVLENT